MSLLWPQLGDPLLYLQHSPFVVWAVIESLVAIWAATSRAHWLWRWLAVIGAVTLMVPARAWEPAWFYALSSPLIVALLWRDAWWRRRRAANEPSSGFLDRREPFRFALRDLFLVTVVVAVALPGTVALIRHFQPFNVLGWLVSSGALAVLAALTYRCAAGPRRRLSALLLIVAIPSCAVAIWCAGDWTKMWDLLRIWDEFTISIATLIVLEAQFVIVLLMVLALAAAFQSSAGMPGRHVAYGSALAAVMAAVLGWAALFYVQLVEPVPPRPPKFVANPNHYDRILAIASRVNVVNNKNVSIAELRLASVPITALQEIEALYAEVLPLLEVANAVPYDPDRDPQDNSSAMDLGHIQMFRGLCRCFTAESKAAWESGDPATAMKYGQAILRLGGMLGRGGLTVNALIGTAAEGVGYEQFARIRKELPAEQQRQAVAALQRLSHEREDTQAVLARDADFSERAYGLSERLNTAIYNLGVAYWQRNRLEDWVTERETINALLQTDLAIRLFQADRRRLPGRLQELIPEYLSSVPIDLFSGQAPIYRLENGDFTLYSVAFDRRDDGGNFGQWPAYSNARSRRQPGLDLSLDNFWQP